jgi:SAM-dependent methyltransferase
MTPPSLEYTGLDVLETLGAARNYNRYLTDLVEAGAADARTAVDFGAGIGTFSELIRQRGFHVRCVEADPHLAGRLRAESLETFTDLADLPDESVEYVFSLNVFEHIEDDCAVLQALAAKIRSGGRLLIYVPAFESLWTGLDDRLHHYRRYTSDSLRELVEHAGFRVERCRYADSLGYLAALIFKVIGNKEGKLSPLAVNAYDCLAIPVSIILDRISGGFLGKNVYAICTKA